MSEENKENGFNHVKTFTKIIFIFSVLVFNDNEYKITDAAVNLFIRFNEKFIMRYFILMFTFVCSFVAAQPTIVPQLQQQVTDLTSSLNSQEKKELTHKLESIFNNTQVQIAVLIVPTTKDETIEQYATRVLTIGV